MLWRTHRRLGHISFRWFGAENFVIWILKKRRPKLVQMLRKSAPVFDSACLQHIWCPHNEIKPKQNSFTFKTISKPYWNCFVSEKQNKQLRPWNVLALLANHSQYLLFARQSRGGGVVMTCAWRSRSQGCIVARYCKTLLFGITTRVSAASCLK